MLTLDVRTAGHIASMLLTGRIREQDMPGGRADA